MCYIVYQKSGSLADLAKKYSEIRIHESLESAIAFFEASGFKSEAPKNSVWWIYNADSFIKSRYNVTYKEVENWLNNRNMRNTEKNYAIATCAIATKKQGGDWDFYYEY